MQTTQLMCKKHKFWNPERQVKWVFQEYAEVCNNGTVQLMRGLGREYGMGPRYFIFLKSHFSDFSSQFKIFLNSYSNTSFLICSRGALEKENGYSWDFVPTGGRGADQICLSETVMKHTLHKLGGNIFYFNKLIWPRLPKKKKMANIFRFLLGKHPWRSLPMWALPKQQLHPPHSTGHSGALYLSNFVQSSFWWWYVS